MIAGNGPQRVAANTTTARYISNDRCSVSVSAIEYFSATRPAVTAAVTAMAFAEPRTTARGSAGPAIDGLRPSARRKHACRIEFDCGVNSGPETRICIAWVFSPTHYVGIRDFRIDLSFCCANI